MKMNLAVITEAEIAANAVKACEEADTPILYLCDNESNIRRSLADLRPWLETDIEN